MTDTSRFFARSQSQATMSDEMDVDELSEIEASQQRTSKTSRTRQMKLDFSNGSMATKKPLVNPIPRNDSRRLALKDVADETLLLLPGLLATRPDVTCDSHLCQKETLDARFNPKLAPVIVQVINEDTIDAALSVQRSRPSNYSGRSVAILNMASEFSAGGGFRHGAMAQEEALCYRSSLYMTLKKKYYPIPADAAVYSPSVMVIRDSFANGHDLLDFRRPSRLEVLAVISCAAVRKPSVNRVANGRQTYALQSEKKLMFEKMRIILRTAIRNRHRQIILGALGCGAFRNPNTEVAIMWKQVLQEPEFQGGWWETVVFAVMGSTQLGDNFRVFRDELDGLQLT